MGAAVAAAIRPREEAAAVPVLAVEGLTTIFATPEGEVKALIGRFGIVRFALGDATALTTPDGRRTTAMAWARELQVGFTPAMVFFDAGNREVFRFDGYVRPFHVAGSLDYVASGAYRTQPEFQRFLQDKAERARARGQTVDLWR